MLIKRVHVRALQICATHVQTCKYARTCKKRAK